jgi:hypothetical protein
MSQRIERRFSWHVLGQLAMPQQLGRAHATLSILCRVAPK